jgi:hypothetical protein
MNTSVPRAERPARLDPVRRLRPPRRSTTLRVALVAVLLLTAAGLVHSGGDAAGDTGGLDQDTGPAAGGTTASPTAWVTPGAQPGAEPGEGDGSRQPIPDGMVGLPVPLGEPAALAVLRAGDRVDLLAVPASGGDPAPMADGAAVLAVDHASAAVLLALTPDQARDVVAAPAATRFAVIVRP